MNLLRFGTADGRLFARRLEAATRQLQAALPRRAASWGVARKLLNIFLRDCLYNTYLTKAYGLKRAERYFEVPLDSITAGHLRDKVPELPRWRGVKYLTPEVSAAYQTAAQFIADRRDIARVHLDAAGRKNDRINEMVFTFSTMTAAAQRPCHISRRRSRE
jgi:hypothetical protein